MQATVASFDPTTGGTLVLDDGVTVDYDADALDASPVRHLRPGQRVIVTTTDDEPPRVQALRIT
ncbi:hypothetical protein CLV56_3367 [Mumia flava]|uniref:Cold shock CspA family protein n=1 Tax=Mumia flava TaxID=1348852 RepID=A0A0B2BBM7_9ACTN|nr:hypothetical protein [Mumia flava]PJJ53867.1 hypothetical protein CLV56_3367 [Mumia flava]